MICHNYIVFSCSPLLYDISKKTQNNYKKEFLTVLNNDKNVIVHTYATLGLKVNTNILLWFQADAVDVIQNLVNTLVHTNLGKYLTITQTLFGMTRSTQYSSHTAAHLDTGRKGGKYLVIYPFTKTKEWFMLHLEKRKNLMKGHIAIGRKFPQITQLLLYSFGVDDQEFIVSYETNSLTDFQTLVMALRSDKVREYTLKDTPIFTCIYKTPKEVLDFL